MTYALLSTIKMNWVVVKEGYNIRSWCMHRFRTTVKQLNPVEDDTPFLLINNGAIPTSSLVHDGVSVGADVSSLTSRPRLSPLSRVFSYNILCHHYVARSS